MNVWIRPATESDAPAMVALLNPIIRAGGLTIMDREIDVAEQRAFLRGFPDAGVFNVATDRTSGRLLGMQDVMPTGQTPTIGAISTFVALDRLRQGIGAALTDFTLHGAAQRGYTRLRAVILAANTGAIAFYQRMGFTVIPQLRADSIVAELALHTDA